MTRRNLTIYLFLAGVIFFALGFFFSAKAIENSVKAQCAAAQDKYKNDCVDSLMMLIKDGNAGYREKNNAIWALGQLGDKRALSFLQKYYTGYDRKIETKLDESISQYELYKAIKLLNGGFNATAFLWR